MGDKNGISPQAEPRLPRYLKVTITRTDKLRNHRTCKDEMHFDVFVVSACAAVKESDKETMRVSNLFKLIKVQGTTFLHVQIHALAQTVSGIENPSHSPRLEDANQAVSLNR